MWTFDPQSGTWKDSQLSAALIAQANPGFGLVTVVALRSSRPQEFGRAIQIPAGSPDAWIVHQLAQSLKTVLTKVEWTMVPELRRANETETTCSCGQVFMLDNYGVDVHQHLQANLTHTVTMIRRLGSGASWYGQGYLTSLAALPMALAEGAEVPMLPSCAKPNVHAPDCECALL
jgi:hypothetical protein